MDIYILRDGKEIGPFSEETTKTLLGQGSISEGDLAWHPGLPKWIALATVLKPVPPLHDTPPPPPAPGEIKAQQLPTFASVSLAPQSTEPVTEKQKALLKYLGIPFTAATTKDQAALLINETIEDPRLAGLLTKWNTERMKIRPDLFAAEIQEQKEARAGEYFEICQTEGADYFTKITKPHCQVIVGYLDGKFPHWNEDPKTAPRNYFFPAVAEKFPQLVAKAWKGKLCYATETQVPSTAGAKRPATGPLRKKKAAPQLPQSAITRGLVFAALLLGMFFFVKKVLEPEAGKPAQPEPKTSDQPVPKPAVPPLDAPAPELPKPEAVPGGETVVVDDPFAPVPPAGPANPPEPPKDSEPKMATDPAVPKPADPAGFPPDPLAPGTPPAAPSVPPVVAAKSVLKLTKAVEVQLAYGKMKLPVGTNVKFISHEGNSVKVTYLNTVLTIPSASTDFGVPDAAPPAAAVPPAAPAAPPATDL